MDSQFWWNMSLGIIIGIFQSAWKNEALKKRIRGGALKVRDLINVLFPEDEFTAARAAKAKKTLDQAA